MKFTSEPDRIAAIVVGIEEYEADKENPPDEAWRLHGPAMDAIRFAQWLIVDRNVPARNVRLFASLAPADEDTAARRQELLTDLEDRGLRPEGPTQKVLFEALQAPPADPPLGPGETGGLILFWSGHGFAEDRTRSRALLCADATAKYGYSIDITDVTDRWRVLPGFAKFGEQWVTVDACGQWLSTLGVEPSFATTPFPPARAHDAEQYLIFATPAGGLARTDVSKNISVFTSALLHALPATDDIDLEAVWSALNRRFDGDSQSPTVERRTPQGQSAVIGGNTRSSPAALAPSLDGVPNNCIQRAFLTTDRCAGLPVPESFVAAVHCLEALVESKQRGTLTPVQRFLACLAQICRDEKPSAATIIDAWLDRHVVDKPGLTSERKRLAQPAPLIATLEIWFPPSDVPTDIRAVLDFGDGESRTWTASPGGGRTVGGIASEEKPPTTATVIVAARRFAYDAIRARPAARRPSEVVIELRVPSGRLKERLDTIEIDLSEPGDPDEMIVRLGEKNVALLRVWDRGSSSERLNYWSNAWADVHHVLDEGGGVFAIHWIESIGDRAFPVHDFRAFPWIGFTFRTAEDDQMRRKPLARVLAVGAPLVVWPCQDPPSASDIDAFKTLVTTRLGGATLKSLREHLVQQHTASNGAMTGSLIIDRPPDSTDPADLVQPKQKGTP
jgi:hypothetical protein